MKTQKLPGETLVKIARLVFDEDTVERILTPALSDMQQEWMEAERSGRRFGPLRAAAARLRGYFDFMRTAFAISAVHGVGRLRNLPPALVLAPIALACLGVFWIRAAALGGNAPSSASFYKMQAAYLAAGVVLMTIAALTPVRRLATRPLSLALFGASVLGATLIFGIELEGARRWVSLAGFLNVLPGELLKPLFLIAVAGSLIGSESARPARSFASLAAIGALFVAPIALQPDPALAAVFLLSLGVMTIAAGGTALRRAAIAIPCVSLALIGLFTGGGATSNLGDRHTDFISRVIVEQAGFWGVGVVAALMILTLASMRSAATRGGDPLLRVLAAGASAMWISQAAIHLGGALGALPRTGIALPLLSYGGSSVVSFFLTLGLLAGASTRAPRQSPLAPRSADEPQSLSSS